MGAGSSRVYSQELKNPTRCVTSRLILESDSETFTFVQEMKKGVGEEQSLRTRVIYSGKTSRLETDKIDLNGRKIFGNEQLYLEVLLVKFEIEWGSEAHQKKKGTLIREDLHERKKDRNSRDARISGVKRRLGMNQFAAILSSTPPSSTSQSLTSTNPQANMNSQFLAPLPAIGNSTGLTRLHQQTQQQPQSQSPPQSQPQSATAAQSHVPTLLPPAIPSLPRGYSQSAPLSPAPLSASEHSHIDTDSGLTIQPQPLTASVFADKSKTSVISSSAATAFPASSTTSFSYSSAPSSSTSSPPSPASPTSTSTGSSSLPTSPMSASSMSFLPALSSLSSLPRTFSALSAAPRRLTILSNGLHHAQLQRATSLEEMYELLQHDTPDWYGTFNAAAMAMQVEMLSSQIKIQYHKAKFEYLWAQVQDECPIIMALSNVFHDPSPCQLYIDRDQRKEKPLKPSRRNRFFNSSLASIRLSSNHIQNDALPVEVI